MRRKSDVVVLANFEVGQGVVAAKKFRRNQVIGEISGNILDDPLYDSRYCIDLGDGRSLEPGAPFRFLNHSCDPNCEVFYWEPEGPESEPIDSLFLQALRTIQLDEQLTIDYGWPADFAIPCLCGSPHCRGWVVSEEELPLVLERENVSLASPAKTTKTKKTSSPKTDQAKKSAAARASGGRQSKTGVGKAKGRAAKA